MADEIFEEMHRDLKQHHMNLFYSRGAFAAIIILQIILLFFFLTGKPGGAVGADDFKIIAGNCSKAAGEAERVASALGGGCSSSGGAAAKRAAAEGQAGQGSGSGGCSSVQVGNSTVVILREPASQPNAESGQSGQGNGAPGAGGENGNETGAAGEDGSARTETTTAGSGNCYTVCETPAPSCENPETTDSCVGQYSPCGNVYGANYSYGECCSGFSCVSGYCSPPANTPGPTTQCMPQNSPCGNFYGSQYGDCCTGLTCLNNYCYNSSIPQTNPQPSATCTDSDGGRNYTVRGNASGKYNGYNGSYADYCDTGLNRLYEYYCSGNADEVLSESVACENGCAGGACVSQTAPTGSGYLCSDSDGGRDYEERGNVIASSPNSSTDVTDVCDSASSVTEYYCLPGLTQSAEVHACQYGCGDGRCLPAPVCTDTDGGIIYDAFGTASGMRNGVAGNYSDYCGTSPYTNYLAEYYCSNGLVYNTSANCVYGCANGGCQAKPPAYSCTDSDGGKDYYKAGAIMDSYGNTTDYCSSSSALREYYCITGGFSSELYTCPKGCAAGKCN